MTARRILIIEDEAGVRFGLRDFLEVHGYAVTEADDCATAERVYQEQVPDLVVLDYLLPDGNALDLLPRLRAHGAPVPVIILTGHGSIDLAVRAIKEGAEHFLTKPVELPSLLAIVERSLETQRLRRAQRAQRATVKQRAADPFLGSSAAIRGLAAEAERAARSESPVLIQGETGSGKGVLARWLHDHGPRASEAFVDLSCAGLSPDLLETELFGHERGAFTGAVARKQGLLEVAHRGTLFLDEIGDVDPRVQPRLLKVLEEKRFRRVGDVRDRQVDVRLVAATHRELASAAEESRFRQDLYYRISTLPLRVPTLRERPEDIPLLARLLLDRIARDTGRSPAVQLTPEAMNALRAHGWPGNIRELRNTIERALLRTGGEVIGPEEIFPQGGRGPTNTDPDLDLSLEEVERRHVQRVLQAEEGHVGRAAQRLGVPRSSLYQKLKRLGLR